MSSKLTQRKGKDVKAAGEKEKGVATESDADKVRYTNLIEAASEKAPEKVRPYIKQVAPSLATAAVLFQKALPYIIQLVTLIQGFVAKLPEHVLYASLGLFICFFGGAFPATIAAFEAWRLCGGLEAINASKDIFAEVKKVQQSSGDDDKKDEDNDGVADVNQISGKELLARKMKLAIATVDPDTVSSAMTGIWTGWIGVLAVLKVQFARTVTLGEVIGSKLYLVASRAEPSVEAMLPADYQKWVPTIVRWTCSAIAISIAWWVQRVCSAFHSAIRGGHLISKHLGAILKEKGMEIPYADEFVGWGVAICGFVFQFVCGFGVPFPLNFVLFPMYFIEWFIIWSVSSSNSVTF